MCLGRGDFQIPSCLVWKPLNRRTAAGKTPLDLPGTQNHYVLFVMEGLRRKEEDRKKKAFALFEEDFGGLKFGHRYELQTTTSHDRAKKRFSGAFFLHSRVKGQKSNSDTCSYSFITMFITTQNSPKITKKLV